MKHRGISMKWLGVYLAILFSGFLTGCFDKVANGTEIGNNEKPAIAGLLVYEDGTRPVGAKISVRPAGTLADTSGFSLAKMTVDTFTTTTDDTGAYAIDTGVLDPGTYVIEGDDGVGNLVLIDSVIVEENTTVEVPEDTLKAAGALKGVVLLSEGGDPRKVFVLAFGIDRFARVEADGSFKFEDLAESEYDLRILSTIDDYGVLDTLGVAVVSADTTDLDTLKLPFEGIPTVKNLKLDYDTLLQVVTLTWDAADPDLVAGFDVYRQHVVSGLVKINTNPIPNNIFMDSTLIQNETYVYQIKSLDSKNNSSEFSNSISMTAVSSIEFIGNFCSPELLDEYCDNVNFIHFDNFDNVFLSNYLVDSATYSIYMFTPEGGFVDNIFNIESLNGITSNSNSEMFLGQSDGVIQKIDSSGVTLSIINGIPDSESPNSGNPIINPWSIKFSDINNWLLVPDRTNNKLNFFGASGNLIKAVQAEDIWSTIEISPSKLAILHGNNTISIIDTSGLYLSSWTCKIQTSLAITSNGNLAGISGINSDHEILFYSQEGILLGRYGVKGNNEGSFSSLHQIAIDQSNILYTTNKDSRHSVQKFLLPENL